MTRWRVPRLTPPPLHRSWCLFGCWLSLPAMPMRRWRTQVHEETRKGGEVEINCQSQFLPRPHFALIARIYCQCADGGKALQQPHPRNSTEENSTEARASRYQRVNYKAWFGIALTVDGQVTRRLNIPQFLCPMLFNITAILLKPPSWPWGLVIIWQEY